MVYRYGMWYIDMVIYHIDVVILDIDMGDEANDMGDDSIDTVISHIDMEYIVTLVIKLFRVPYYPQLIIVTWGQLCGTLPLALDRPSMYHGRSLPRSRAANACPLVSSIRAASSRCEGVACQRVVRPWTASAATRRACGGGGVGGGGSGVQVLCEQTVRGRVQGGGGGGSGVEVHYEQTDSGTLEP